jgi:hypothetical protein
MKLICNFISFLKIFVIIQEKWQIQTSLGSTACVWNIFQHDHIQHDNSTKACTNSSARWLWCLQFLWWYSEFSSIILLPVHDPLKTASKIICSFLSFIPYASLSNSLLSPLLFSHSFCLSCHHSSHPFHHHSLYYRSCLTSVLPILHLFMFFLPYSFLNPIIVLLPVS